MAAEAEQLEEVMRAADHLCIADLKKHAVTMAFDSITDDTEASLCHFSHSGVEGLEPLQDAAAPLLRGVRLGLLGDKGFADFTSVARGRDVRGLSQPSQVVQEAATFAMVTSFDQLLARVPRTPTIRLPGLSRRAEVAGQFMAIIVATEEFNTKI